jgi:hypothetical protein
MLLSEPYKIHGYTLGENTVELAYVVMKRAETYASLQTCVFITEEYDVVVKQRGIDWYHDI